MLEFVEWRKEGREGGGKESLERGCISEKKMAYLAKETKTSTWFI